MTQRTYVQLGRAELERFFQKVERRENGCWEWTAGHYLPPSYPYGRFKKDGVTKPAHRVIFEHIFGPLPSGVWALHKCDNPKCVNPFHLFSGTPKDNTQDCIQKGRRHLNTGLVYRSGRGEDHGLSKLTAESVLQIRSKYVRGVYGVERLAKEHGVSKPTIVAVLRKETWAHV